MGFTQIIANSGSAALYRRYKHPTNLDVEVVAMGGGTFAATAVVDTQSLVPGDLITTGVQVLAVEPLRVGQTYQAFAEVEFAGGGSGAVQPMLTASVQDSAFANLIQLTGLGSDGSSYGGITALQDTRPMLLCSREFTLPSGFAYIDIGVRLWSAAGASGTMIVKSISVVRVS